MRPKIEIVEEGITRMAHINKGGVEASYYFVDPAKHEIAHRELFCIGFVVQFNDLLVLKNGDSETFLAPGNN